MPESIRRFETELIHGGEPSPRVGGAAVVPIFQCAVFEYEDGAGYHDVRYPRLSNLVNHSALGAKLARLERGEAAIVTASGMAAIATTLLTVLRGGGHLLAHRSLYGGTHNLLTEDMGGLGVTFGFIDACRPDIDAWDAARRPETRAIYVEAMTNPTLEIADHRAIVDFAKARGLITIIDNTFATPVNFRPLELGYDICVHSATKYLNGHADVAAGAVIGSASWIERILHLGNHLGGSLDPHACFLLHRGIKTLSLRVHRQNENALALARFLAARPEVTRVNYPGLESHPGHAIARELFAGFGGMMSFDIDGGVAAAERLLSRLTLPIHAASLGGLETLITRPSTTSHKGMAPAARAALGITDTLFRVSVGIEDVRDIIDDFAAALGA